MEIKECRISGFGCYVNETIKFDDNLFVLYEGNGYGKSTLFAFIVAMIFGYDKKNKFDDREHYAPFESSNFGGTIIISHNGDIYQIERSFSRKSKSDDTLKVYINDKEQKNVSDDLGLQYFGISEEVFKNTIFIDHKEFDCNLDSSIVEKLTGSVSGDDSSKFAIDNLEELRKLVANGSNSIRILKGQISDDRAKVSDIKELNEDIDSSRLELAHSKEQLKEIDEKISSFDKASGNLKLVASINEKKEKLNELNDIYKNGLPSVDEFKIIEEHLSNISKYEYSISNLKGNVNDGATLVTDDVISSFRFKINEITKLEKDISINNTDEEIEKLIEIYNEKEKKQSKVLPIVFVILLLLGVIGLFVINWLVFLGFSVLAIIVLVLLLVQREKIKETNKKTAFRRLINAKEKDSKALVDLYNEVIKSRDAKKKICDLQKDIELDFASYGITCSSYIDGMNMLSSKRSEAAALSNINDYKDKIENEKKEIEVIASKYQLIITSSNIAMLKQASQDLVSLEKEIEKYKDDDIDNVDLSLIDIEKLREDKRKLSKQIEDLVSSIGSKEKTLADLEDLKAALVKKEELLKDKENKERLIKTAKDLLAFSSENITKEYVDPIRQNFGKYSKAIEKAIGSSIEIASDFKVYLNKNNQRHDWHHLSTGEQTILMLCFRLALADSLLKGNKHFVILDDPLSFLDKEHLKNAKEVIKDISKDTQIIYLTCSEERNI